MKDKRILAAAGLVALLAIVVVAMVVTGLSKQCTVTPAISDEEGISPDTAFVLKMKRSTTLEDLETMITMEPQIAYNLEETGDKTFTLTPIRMLDASSTLTIMVGNQSFPFTVQNRLLVMSTYPVNEGVEVPVNSGIEFKFNSNNISKESFQKAFSITPEVDGDISYGDGRFVFYPLERLAYSTTYQITLSADKLESGEGAKLSEDTVITFSTMSEQEEDLQHKFQIADGGISVNSLSSEAPLVQVFIDSAAVRPEQLVKVSLHRFDSAESYRASMEKNMNQPRYKYASNHIDTSELNSYAEFQLAPIKAQQDDDEGSYDRGIWILPFPETLPEGWYAATLALDIDGATATRQIYLQVSDLSVFYMALNENMVVWVNDGATSEPVQDATVLVTGNYRAKGTTNKDGIADIQNASPPVDYGEENGVIFTITAGERSYVDVDSYYYISYDEQGATARDYMAYIYTDRPIYHPDDTIEVWGVVQPRSSKNSVPETINITLGDNILSREVKPAQDGTFQVSLPLESLTSGFRSVDMKIGDSVIKSAYVDVTDYVKPVYAASTAPEKPVYLLKGDDTVAANLNVSLFDGTPASQFAVKLSAWSGMKVVGAPNQVSDENGHIRSVFKVSTAPADRNANTWRPQNYQYQYYNEDAQSENFYLTGEVSVIHRDVMLQTIPKMKDGKMTVEVTSNQVDISRIQKPQDLWDVENIKGAPVTSKVSAEIHHVYYTKMKTGTHYDFISRTNVESFRYERHDDVVDTKSFTAGGDVYTLDGLPQCDFENCYYVVFSTTDSLGRKVENQCYLGIFYDRYSAFDNGTHTYSLMPETQNEPAQNDSYWWDYATKFQDNEDVTFNLLDNEEKVQNFKGRILYSVAQHGFSETKLSSQSQVTIPFGEDLLPNYMVTGAYFDGKHVFALEDTFMQFDPKQRELDIQLKTSEKSYGPGDELKVNALVKNKYSGAPVKDAAILLSVVDEAVFAIRDHDSGILRGLYESIYYPYVRKYTSYLQHDAAGAGEKGGGGGDDMRMDFADTAYFQSGKTDEQGRIQFSFKLPDNITSWRLTSLASTKDGQAGNSKEMVSATKDYFVLPIINETLVEGDSFTVASYSSGVGVGDADPVSYKVTLNTKDGATTTLETTSTIRKYAHVDFGKIPIGDYTVTIEGTSGSFKDVVRLPVTVVRSALEVAHVKTSDLKDGITVEPLRYPVTVSFYTAGSKPYRQVFRSVVNSMDGGRADMRIARWYVAQQFKKWDAYWFEEDDMDLSGLNGSSLLSLTGFSEQDLELTVKARLAAPDLVGTDSLKGLDISQMEWIQGAKSSLYLAQALAGDTVTSNLSAMLEKGADLDYVDKMYLIMTMASTEKTKEAQEWYDKLVKPNLVEISSIAGDKALYVDVKDPKRSVGDCTAAASMVATMLKTKEAEPLARYLAEKKSSYEPFILEQIYYLSQTEPISEKATFSYTRDGKKESVDLSLRPTTLSFTKEQLAEANFKIDSGEVFVDVFYTGTPDQVADNSRKIIGITKKVEAVDGGEIKVGSPVKVTLTPDLTKVDTTLGDNWMIIDEYIPTGMRFEQYSYNYNARGWYLESRQGQRLQFSVYGSNILTTLDPIVYYARCSTPGEYVVESAYISSAHSDTWGASDRSKVEIQ